MKALPSCSAFAGRAERGGHGICLKKKTISPLTSPWRKAGKQGGYLSPPANRCASCLAGLALSAVASDPGGSWEDPSARNASPQFSPFFPSHELVNRQL